MGLPPSLLTSFFPLALSSDSLNSFPLVRVLRRMPEIVIPLKVQPQFRRRVKRSG